MTKSNSLFVENHVLRELKDGVEQTGPREDNRPYDRYQRNGTQRLFDASHDKVWKKSYTQNDEKPRNAENQKGPELC